MIAKFQKKLSVLICVFSELDASMNDVKCVVDATAISVIELFNYFNFFLRRYKSISFMYVLDVEAL